MREWLVASGIVEGPEGILLVQNRRRTGALDWSTPGGVVEVESGESVLEGLTREVLEETGISVAAWEGPVYEVETVAEELGWHLRVEVHRAIDFSGELRIGDLDNIVVDARWVALEECSAHLEACPRWVREPLETWLGARDVMAAPYRYRVRGADRSSIAVDRL